VAEEELVEEYAQGGLSDSARERFEHSFLCTPEGRQQLNFSLALKKYVSEATAAAAATESAAGRRAHAMRSGSFVDLLRFISPAAQLSLASAALLVLLGGGWLIASIWRLQNQLGVERARNQQLSEQLQREQNNPAPSDSGGPVSALGAIILTPGVTRESGQHVPAPLPADATSIRLQLNLRDDDYKTYRVVLQNVGGQEIWRQAALPSQNVGVAKAVVVAVPAELLSNEDYVVRLSGATTEGEFEEVDRYFFRAARR
jgi:hypothetical protein